MLRENLEAENDGRRPPVLYAAYTALMLQAPPLIYSSTSPVPQRTRTRPIELERHASFDRWGLFQARRFCKIGQREGVHLFISLRMSLVPQIHRNF